MKLWVVVIFIGLFPFSSYAFDGCSAYFSGQFERGKNKPLSQMMQTLQESLWDIQDFARNAKGAAVDPNNERYLSAFNHVYKIARIAQMMHQKHSSALAPGRTLSIPSERQAAYLKMYSQYTEMFVQMTVQMQDAFKNQQWDQVEAILLTINNFSAEAHMRVESNQF